jgi:hypothetical protein
MDRTRPPWWSPAVSRRFLVVALVAACGNDHAVNPDATIVPDSPPLPPGCDYVELSDSTNDLTVTNGVPEPAGLAFVQSVTICGRIDHGHFDATSTNVDADSFELTFAAPAQLLVGFAGTGAETLASIDVQVLDDTRAPVDGSAFLGNHAIFASELGPGKYTFTVLARNAADIPASIDYKLRIVTDAPDTRCAKVTGPAAYTETTDGPQSNRNDVVEVRYQDEPHRALTASAQDVPEPSGIVTAAGTNVRITGISAAVDAPDEFKDRDAYLVTTGAHDQLSMRLDWAGTDTDLDFMVFPDNMTAEIASGTTVAKQGPEQATFPVLPNTRYWIWVGSYDTSAGLPLAYDVTLCPSQFTP